MSTSWRDISRDMYNRLLNVDPCEEHRQDPQKDCPFCADWEAMKAYQFKVQNPRAQGPSWEDVAYILANRLKHLALSACGHPADEQDPKNCPYCDDRRVYQRFVKARKR